MPTPDFPSDDPAGEFKAMIMAAMENASKMAKLRAAQVEACKTRTSDEAMALCNAIANSCYENLKSDANMQGFFYGAVPFGLQDDGSSANEKGMVALATSVRGSSSPDAILAFFKDHAPLMMWNSGIPFWRRAVLCLKMLFFFNGQAASRVEEEKKQAEKIKKGGFR